MATLRPLGQKLDITKSFAHEDGANYRHWRQDFDPIIKRVEHLRHKVNEAPRSGNKSGMYYRGSIPMSLLLDWLNSNGYRFDEWARNDGGQNGTLDDYRTDPGVKSKFLRYFYSREFAKLHTQHTTTKKAFSSVPGSIKRQAVDLGYLNGS